jgi:electron transport complex protein RnfC
MKLFSFRGGVHPPYEKGLTKDRPIQDAGVPETLLIPLVQHIGAPCEPAVSPGDTVKEGQVVGKARGFVSAPVHSPVSGTVKKIEKVLHPLGVLTDAVSVQQDGKHDRSYMKPLGNNVEELDRKQMVDRVMEAGIVGLGGATFPAHVKFSPPKEKPIDTFIVNGCECEPFLSADHRLMIERPEDIVLGAAMIGKILGVSRLLIAVEENKPDALEVMSRTAGQRGMVCMVTQTKYPQGAEKVLIKALLGREVPSGGLPMDVGVVVSNVGTALAVCEAVRDGKPLIDRVVTLTGNGLAAPGNFLARIGTPIGYLVEKAGGLVGTTGKVVMGGPMMGLAQPNLDVPVIKGSSGILVMQEEPYMREGHLPCIKCSFCVQACPVSLLPSKLSVIAEAKQWKRAESYGVNDCIECGCCTYVCPSKRPIVQLVKTTKLKLREIKAREKK